MTNTHSTIRCKNCRHVFRPDMQASATWLCPNCQTKTPNLKRHYRAVAGLCCVGFVVTLVVLLQGFNQRVSVPILVGNTVVATLFLITTMLVYKAQSPWVNAGIRALIFLVYGLAVLLTVIVPLALEGILNMSPIILCALVFPYLFWVDGHARFSVPAEPGMHNERKMEHDHGEGAHED